MSAPRRSGLADDERLACGVDDFGGDRVEAVDLERGGLEAVGLVDDHELGVRFELVGWDLFGVRVAVVLDRPVQAATQAT